MWKRASGIRAGFVAARPPPARHQLAQADGLARLIIGHDFHVPVFIGQLHQKFPAPAAGHAAALDVPPGRLIPEGDEPPDDGLAAVYVHIEGSHPLCAQVHDAAAALDAKAREDLPVLRLQGSDHVMGVNEGRHVLRMILRLGRLIELFPDVHIVPPLIPQR